MNTDEHGWDRGGLKRQALSVCLCVHLWLIPSVCISGSLAAQEASFKVGVRTVAVWVTVKDALGNFVPDLPKESFEILDNAKPQPITLFAKEVQPITVVILLDRSGSMRQNFERVQEAAEAFVKQMLPDDKARIGSFSNRIQLDPRDFTSDHDEMLKILQTELQEEGPTPLWNAVNVGITALLHQSGRRVVLVFTDGVDMPMNFSSNNISLKDATKRAEEEDVMVYAIGLAGMNPPAGIGGWSPGRGGFGRPRGAADHPDPGLPKIASQTGGGYFELTSTADLAKTFARVADELHHQYALGFAPTTLDGKLHTLDVRVNASGLTARARRSYRATRDR
jgi:Ca-activated chloride channel family protein